MPARGVFAPGSNQRDSEAAGLHTTAHCLTLIPRRRVPLAGSVGAKRIKVGGTTERTMWVVCGPGSKAARPASQRSEKRSVRLFLHANSAGDSVTSHLANICRVKIDCPDLDIEFIN